MIFPPGQPITFSGPDAAARVNQLAAEAGEGNVVTRTVTRTAHSIRLLVPARLVVERPGSPPSSVLRPPSSAARREHPTDPPHPSD